MLQHEHTAHAKNLLRPWTVRLIHEWVFEEPMPATRVKIRIRIFSSELTSLTYQFWWCSSPWRSDSSPTRVGYVVEVSEILLNMQGNPRTARNPGKINIGCLSYVVPMSSVQLFYTQRLKGQRLSLPRFPCQDQNNG